MNKYLKITAIILLISIFMIGIVAAADTNSVDAASKSVKKVEKKYKVVKTTKNTKIIEINGKNQTLKKVSVYGRHTPAYAWMNSKYIMISNARCTCGSYKHIQKKTKLFENRVYKTSTKNPVTKWGTIKINPKKVSDGEFTSHAKGTRYHSIDFCLFDAREKMPRKAYYMKEIV